MKEFPITIMRKNPLRPNWLFQLSSDKLQSLYILRKLEQKEFDHLKELLLEKLEQEITTISGKNRSDLVGLKRKIFNDSISKIPLEELSFDLKERVVTLKDCKKKLDSIKLEIEQVIENEYLKEREIIYKVSKNPNIRNGICFLSSSAYSRYRRYISQLPIVHNKKNRNFDYYLLKILCRATLKLSPFSTLTSSEILCHSSLKGIKQKKNSVQINYKLLLEVFEKLKYFNDFLVTLHFYMNDTVTFSGNQVVYTASKSRNDSSKVFETLDTFYKFPKTKFLEDLYYKIGSVEKISYKNLLSFIADYYPSKESQIIQFLLENKMLLSVEYLSESPHILEDLLKWISDKNSKNPIVNKVSLLLLESKRLLEIINYNFLHSEVQIQSLKDCFGQICELLNINNVSSDNFIYQDIVELRQIEKESLTVDNKSIRKLLILTRLFDSNLFFQLLFGQYYYNKYGREHQKVGTSEEIVQDIVNIIIKEAPRLANVNLETYYPDEYMSNTLKQLLLFREEFIKNILNGVDVDETVVIENDFVEELENFLKENDLLDFSNSIFFQLSGDKVIVNNIYPGYLAYFNRFLTFYPKIFAIKEVGEYIDFLNFEKRIADMFYCWGFNANSRVLTAEKIIEIPNHQINAKYIKKVIKMSELLFGVDSNNRIRLFNNRRELIKTIFQGSVIKSAIPALAATLDTISNSGSFQISLSKQIINNLVLSGKDKVTIPRIELDNVVLSRQKIIVSVSYINDFLDLRFPDKIEYILNFLEGSGFNTKVMVYFGKIVEEDKNYFVNLEKPQYFDFTSILFNKLFFKELNKFDYMVIEELIPNLDKDVMMTEYIKEYTE